MDDGTEMTRRTIEGHGDRLSFHQRRVITSESKDGFGMRDLEASGLGRGEWFWLSSTKGFAPKRGKKPYDYHCVAVGLELEHAKALRDFLSEHINHVEAARAHRRGLRDARREVTYQSFRNEEEMTVYDEPA